MLALEREPSLWLATLAQPAADKRAPATDKAAAKLWAKPNRAKNRFEQPRPPGWLKSAGERGDLVSGASSEKRSAIKSNRLSLRAAAG